MNPTGQPFNPQFGAPPPTGGGGAREAVNVPSILLIVFGGLMVLSALYGLVAGGANTEQMSQLLNDPNLPPEAKRALSAFLGPGAKVLNGLTLLLAGTMVFGAVQMRSLKNYPLAMASCILAMIPCTSSCCCIFTLPVGIWALTVIMKPEVKSAFT